MARGMPSMLALLGLLAVAGYQNRDRIGEAINKMQPPNPNGPPTGATGGLGGLLEGLGAGGLANGVGELLNSFKTAGQGEAADSWVRPDVPTQSLSADQVAQAVGEDNLRELGRRLGLSRGDLLDRLASAIPAQVDALTPNGRMPTDDDVRRTLQLPG
jgi:uncharacterized protein YidB (DUF937 family)